MLVVWDESGTVRTFCKALPSQDSIAPFQYLSSQGSAMFGVDKAVDVRIVVVIHRIANNAESCLPRPRQNKPLQSNLFLDRFPHIRLIIQQRL